jgi:hypothetical protein
MKESAVFDLLSGMAENLSVKVSSVNLRRHSYATKSGLCRVRGEYRIILDQSLHLSEKIDVLVDALQALEVDTETMDPAVRKLFDRKAGMEKDRFLSCSPDVPTVS